MKFVTLQAKLLSAARKPLQFVAVFISSSARTSSIISKPTQRSASGGSVWPDLGRVEGIEFPVLWGVAVGRSVRKKRFPRFGPRAADPPVVRAMRLGRDVQLIARRLRRPASRGGGVLAVRNNVELVALEPLE